MIQPILVTGASGSLGRAVVDLLFRSGVTVRQGVRNPAKARPGVESVRLDYDDPATFRAALEEVQGLLLMAPGWFEPGMPQVSRPMSRS